LVSFITKHVIHYFFFPFYRVLCWDR